jgi:serine/threonine-protein kinase
MCGRYELVSHLGKGGMAEVFRAWVSGMAGFRREVVLKKLLSSTAADPEFVGMFTDEARILGGLHHQNVVQALDFGEDGGELYLVLEYVEGPSLSRILQTRRQGIPPVIAAYIAREVCRALDYVHRFADTDGTSLGLVHRDVTPSNVIVTPTGAVKLLDFGIAKCARAVQPTRGGTVKGKPAYLAPEQLTAGKAFDGRVDVFALGIVLHELLVGERLFTADNDLASIKNIMELKIPLPSSKQPSVPPALDRVVMKALARDPERRYASAADMERDLDEIVSSARLRVERVAAFVRDITAEAAHAVPRAARPLPAAPPPVPPAAAPAAAATRWDLAMPLRMWMGARVLRRGTLVAGLGFALGVASAFGIGLRGRGAHAVAADLHVSPAMECRAQAAGLVSAAAPN